MKRRSFIENSSKILAGSCLNAAVFQNQFSELTTSQNSPNASISGSGQTKLSLPQGGGAIKGIGETFQPNPFTGTGNFSVPIFTSPGRGGMTPQLGLQYSTGNGNGPFGLGWSLPVPMVARKTEKGIPIYDDEEDTFLLSGAEDLVPYLIKKSNSDEWIHEVREEARWKIYRYRPRTEGLHALIEYWKSGALKERTERTFWRIVTKDNLTNIYGCSDNSQLSVPDDRKKVAEWRLELTSDAKGNCIFYNYKPDEGLIGDEKQKIWEAHRYKPNQNLNPIFQTYLYSIHYGNLTSYADKNTTGLINILEQGFDNDEFMFKVQFDYGEFIQTWKDPETGILHQDVTDEIYNSKSRKWSIRPDAFSSYRTGFEIRTYRRCERILMFHQIPEFTHPVLVRSTDFIYDQNAYNDLSMLSTVTQRGYRFINDNNFHKSEEVYLGGRGVVSNSFYAIKSFPPLNFKYSSFQPEKQHFQAMQADGDDMPDRALSNPQYALVDLFGTGLPDVLHTSSNGYFYWKNEGSGRFSRRRSMQNMPASIQLGQPGVGFGDMAGNGQADLLVHAGMQWGFFEADGKAGWQTFKPYHQQPSFDIGDPQTRMFDLDGSGKVGALSTSEGALYYFPCLGEEGFGHPIQYPRLHDLDDFPDVYFGDSRVRLADMTGDGLNDIVLVHNGRIDYWANQGYGRFSKRITMENAPNMGADFNPKRFLFLDIDGSGSADALYVEHDKIRFWFNKNGNQWSEKFVIYGTPPMTDFDAVVTTDILGYGANGLLWTSDWRGPGSSNYRFLDFTGGSKPHVLTEMDNSMGSVTRIQYKPSTEFYLDDLKKNPRRNWVSTLPFPVQCVEKVVRIDRLSGTKLVTRYAYHHGYYDGREREFRGFAFVEQCDSESFNDFERETLLDSDLPSHVPNIRESYHVPPVLTKTWYHTGAYDSASLKNESKQLANAEVGHTLDLHELFRKEYYDGDSEAYKTDPCAFDTLGQLDVHSVTEAWRSLRGVVLRHEVYGMDRSAKEKHPYSVSESSFNIRMLQSKGKNKHAVYQVHPLEKLDFHYERIPDDPRVTQELILQTDDFGNVLKSCSIAYPRRGINAEPEQRKLWTTCSESMYINTNEEKEYRHIGVLCNNSTFEIDGLQSIPGEVSTRKFNGNEILLALNESASILTKRRLTQIQTYFRVDNQPQKIEIPEGHPELRTYSARLALSEINKLGLPYEQYTLAFVELKLLEIFGQDFSKDELRTLLIQSGYVRLDDNDLHEALWWQPSGQQALDPVRFYLPIEQSDPWGYRTYTYYDSPLPGQKAMSILSERIVDALNNETRVKNDYISLQPLIIRDANHNGTKVAFDALGLVNASATMGKLNEDFGPDSLREGDYLENYKPLWEYDENYHKYIDRPYEQGIHALLKDATGCMLYDLWRTVRLGQEAPLVVWSAARETHADDQSIIQQKLMYFDGLGRELQTKIEADPSSSAPNQLRWITSGWKIYNNKGKLVRQFEPFYSNKPDFNLVEAETYKGVSSVLFYDPIDRVICTLHPNGIYEKVVFDAWHQKSYDVNDTILSTDPKSDIDIGSYVKEFDEPFDSWLTRNENGSDKERKAAYQTKKHSDTPSINFLDTLGRTFRMEQLNSIDGIVKTPFTTRYKLDIQGNEMAVTDPRNVTCFQHAFDLMSRKLLVDSCDAGKKWILPDIAGQVIWAKDANGNITYTNYDSLHRPTSLWVKSPNSTSTGYLLAQHTIFGEANGASINSKGKIWKTYDGAGMVENAAFDFKGNITQIRRTLLVDKKSMPSWAVSESTISTGTPNISLLNQSEVYSSTSEYDALNRLTKAILPNQQTIKLPLYNKSNLLKTLKVNATEYVKSIEYNAKGQRERIQYGNGVTTKYTFETETYRLLQLRSTNPNGVAIQDLQYTYDPIGNITHIEDQSIDPIFYQNQKIEAVNIYHYDALYRLIAASGRELSGIVTVNDHETIRFKKMVGIPLPQAPSNQQAMKRYAETYEYDLTGNITKKNHFETGLDTDGYGVGAANWIVTQQYENNSNRILSSDTSALNIQPYQHDANGNIINIYSGMIWNYANQLMSITKTVDHGEPQAYYQYDAQGNRIVKTVGSKQRIYLGDYEICTEFNVSSTTIHVVDDKSRIATIDNSSQIGGPLIRFQIGNQLGSASVELNETSEIITYEEYYPYGGSSIYGYKVGLVSTKRYRYSGKEKDEESGLYYYGARYYGAWIGRWFGCDPKDKAFDLNQYFFSRNNPIRYVDFEGKYPILLDETHETITKQAFNSTFGSKYSNNKYFISELINGVRFPDEPQGLKTWNIIRKVKSGDIDESMKKTISYRSHFGDKQIWHSMAISGENPVMTKLRILEELSALYDKAIKFKENGNLSPAVFTAGRILHTVQDSWSPAHVKRDNNGLISRFYDYSKQDPDVHEKIETPSGVNEEDWDSVKVGVPGATNAEKVSEEILENIFSTTPSKENFIHTIIRNYNLKEYPSIKVDNFPKGDFPIGSKNLKIV